MVYLGSVVLDQFMSDHGSVAGILDTGIGHIAGVHVVATSIVIRFTRAHGADDRHMVHLFGHERHVLANHGITGGLDRLEGAAIR